MQAEQFYLSGVDGHDIFVRKWQRPDASPAGIVHLNHGMAEHSARYEPIADLLTAAGYVVYAHDHRGHGHSIPQGGLVGHYADNNGWRLVLADVGTVNQHIRQQHPQLPLVLLGHSMGSFIAQGYCIEQGHTVQAVVLSGSGYTSPAGLRAPRMLIRLEKLRSGPMGRSPLIDNQTFSSFNRQIENPRTEADWLTRHPMEVDKYLADPLCGFLCTNQMWQDLISGLDTLSRERNLRSIPDQLPFYLTSGERDPLSYHRSQHRVNKLADHLRAAGQNDVTVKLYENGRHEIFNELNREEVVNDLLSWMESRLEQQSPLRAAAGAGA
ncbi:MAG: alpha/beta hydrolase [Pseudomonadota bacterium]|nr:alpha/beta hydrolase [Pseudomonadota bacterium]